MSAWWAEHSPSFWAGLQGAGMFIGWIVAILAAVALAISVTLMVCGFVVTSRNYHD